MMNSGQLKHRDEACKLKMVHNPRTAYEDLNPHWASLADYGQTTSFALNVLCIGRKVQPVL